MNKVTAYTDGACDPNPGEGGYGVVFLFKQGDTLHIKTIAVYCPKLVEVTGADLIHLNSGIKRLPIEKDGKFFIDTTNNRMELRSIIEALSRVKDPKECDITIYSDSQWAIKMANGEWNPKENKDIVFKSRDLVRKFHSVTFIWVRGHENDRWNEYCDKMACWALRQKREEPYIIITKEKLK